MNDELLSSVARYAPAWVRYVLTLSTIASSGEGWVLASGDDIAIMDAGGTSALPLWSYRSLAEGASAHDVEGDEGKDSPQPLGMSASELAEKLLPALSQNDVSIAVFPGPGENRLIGADGVLRDLQGFLADPRDVETELSLEPYAIELEGWANLKVPDLGNEDAEEDARFWLLATEDGESVIGVVAKDRPALALFATRVAAEEFSAAAEAHASPRPSSVGSLIGHWLLMAFNADWDVAIVTDEGGSGSVKPVRIALDLAVLAGRRATRAEAETETSSEDS